MEMGFARYYTPLCFWALTPCQRRSSLTLAIRRAGRKLLPSRFLPYASTPPLGLVKIESRPRFDADRSLERERKLDGYLICFLERLCLHTTSFIWMRREKYLSYTVWREQPRITLAYSR